MERIREIGDLGAMTPDEVVAALEVPEAPDFRAGEIGVVGEIRCATWDAEAAYLEFVGRRLDGPKFRKVIPIARELFDDMGFGLGGCLHIAATKLRKVRRYYRDDGSIWPERPEQAA